MTMTECLHAVESMREMFGSIGVITSFVFEQATWALLGIHLGEWLCKAPANSSNQLLMSTLQQGPCLHGV